MLALGGKFILARNIIDQHLNAKDVPEMSIRGVKVERFSVSERDADMFQLRSAVNGRRTFMTAGEYTKLTRCGALWMSDTPDEQHDHHSVIHEAVERDAQSAVVNGLGLGIVVNALLHVPSIKGVDVVELDPDVIELMEPHYRDVANRLGKVVMFHSGDAHTFEWPRGEQWDIAWHDIWETITGDNWESMKTLHRRYAQRVDWQGSWKRNEVRHSATGRY